MLSTGKRLRGLAIVSMIALLSLVLFPAAAQAAYPDRPITIIVPFGAGGGTDQVARVLASLMQDELGVPVNVVNRAGGGGAVGHTAGATAAPDGYTITMITAELAMMHWMGLTNINYTDFEPIGIVNMDPASVMVAANSPWQTLEDLMEDIKANPGKYRASGTGTGAIWDVARVGWLNAAGLTDGHLPWIPSTGAAQALQEMIAGGVHVVTNSISEGAAMIHAGTVRPLAVMGDERVVAFPDVPTLKEKGIDWSLGTWRGFAVPAGTPADVVKTLEAAVAKAVASDQYVTFMNDVGFGILWLPSDEARQFLAEQDEIMGTLMKQMGVAK